MSDFFSLLKLIVLCGTVLVIAFLVLLSLPKSQLRNVFLEVCGWAVAAFSGVYVVSPIDIIPDFIPVLGWIDDLGAIGLGVAGVVTALRARSDRQSLE